MRAAFAVTGSQPPGIGLRCVNRIPHSHGLGSSAAAIVAGILAARALAEPRPRRARTGLLPDGGRCRAAACCGRRSARARHRTRGPSGQRGRLPGRGLTIAWTADGQPRMVRLGPLPGSGRWCAWRPAPVRARSSQAPAARPGAAPGRGGQRRAQRPAGRRADATARRAPEQRAHCSPRPGTGCTRTTGRRRCRKPALWSSRLRRPTSPPSCPGGPVRAGAAQATQEPDYRHHLDS